MDDRLCQSGNGSPSSWIFTHLATLSSVKSACSKSCLPSLSFDHLVRKLKITVLAPTPFYILGSTDSLTSTLKVPLSANIY